MMMQSQHNVYVHAKMPNETRYRILPSFLPVWMSRIIETTENARRRVSSRCKIFKIFCILHTVSMLFLVNALKTNVLTWVSFIFINFDPVIFSKRIRTSYSLPFLFPVSAQNGILYNVLCAAVTVKSFDDTHVLVSRLRISDP